MQLTSTVKNIFNRFYSVEKNAKTAYNIWASTYDNQNGNLMLDLDEIIFTKLLREVDIQNKSVVDIGCGTGRHWEKLYKKQPAQLMGFDISLAMLNKLKLKFPMAITHLVTDSCYKNIKNESFNVLICTLTVAHIKKIEETINDWCALLKKNGDIILTDFHPTMLQQGGKRTFVNKKIPIAVKNYIHSLETIKRVFYVNGFICEQLEEILIDEKVKCYYAKQNALHVFNRFKDTPVIFGMHLKRRNDTQ